MSNDEKSQADQEEELLNEASSTLLGDVMSIVLNQVKALPKSWQELSEAEQNDYLDSIREQSMEAIEQVVYTLNANSYTTVNAIVESVTFKGGVKAVLITDKHNNPAVHDLAESESKPVKILIPDLERFEADGSTAPVADADQSSLDLDQ